MASKFKRRKMCTCESNADLNVAVIYYSNVFTLWFKLAWHSLRHPMTLNYFVKRKG